VWQSALLVAAIACVVALVARRANSGQPTSKAAAAASANAAQPRTHVAIAARPRAAVGGHVFDAEGKPVAGAQVCAWPAQSQARALVTAETEVPRCSDTDREGSYGIDDLFPATPLTISAAANGFAPAGYRAPNGERELLLGDGERRAKVDFTLHPGVALKGSVNDLTGGAISGALVIAGTGPDRAVAASNKKGEFTLWVAPGEVEVSARANGYAPGSTSGHAPDHFFKIDLLPGATLVGRAVLQGEGTPVAGVHIEGIAVEGSWERSSTRTDEEGRFRIEGLSPGRYRIEATSEGREGYTRESVTLAMGETSAEVVVELEPAYVVRGRVVDKASGEPCVGGQVTITDSKQNEFSQAVIEPDGWARMASVLPGDYRVEVSCKDHIPRDDYPHVVVKDKDLPTLSWQVDRGASIRVEVVDEKGRPVPQANVTATAQLENAWGQADHPGADGTYLVAGLKSGSYRVAVTTQDGARGDGATTVSTTEEHLRIEVPRAGAIEGVVEDDAHRPVPHVQVTAIAAGGGPGRGYTTTLDDGTFSITGLASGDYEVRAGDRQTRRRGEVEKDDPRVVKVTLTAPQHAKIKVTTEARSGVIQGRVVDTTDRPVTDAFVELSSDGGGGERQPIMTDTDGRFTVEHLADGEYDVRAHRRGGVAATVEHVKAGTRDVTIKLGAGASIAGTLVGRNGPVQRFSLEARNTTASFSRDELFFHASGQFMLRDLPAGTYELDAEWSGGSGTATVTVADGEQKTGVALTVTMRTRVDGRVVMLEGGAPLAGVMVTLQGSSNVSILSGDGHDNRTGPDGTFHLEGALPGQWTLLVYSRDPTFGQMRIPITVPDGASVTDIGTVRIPRPRVEPGQARGDLGLYVWNNPADACTVRVVYGAAAEAGVQNADVVMSIDGYDVQGANAYLCEPLATVAAGRTVTFALAKGTTVSLTARGY
jgi:protocatechuate 3,4-dioxygenase beta subunit